MLPRRLRMVSGAEFADTVRRGRRIGGRTMVLHHRQMPRVLGAGAGVEPAPVSVPRIGFVVSKSVGNAVTRNRVKRRLRHLVADRIAAAPLPAGSRIVIRALPAAALEPARLGGDLDRAWSRLTREQADGRTP